MEDHISTIRAVVAALESIQQEIGQSQVQLLNVLTDDNEDEWDGPAQSGLLKLEIVQRTIGEIQVQLVEVIPICRPENEPVLSPEFSPIGVDLSGKLELPQLPISESSTKGQATPKDWLLGRGIKVRKIATPSGLDESADRAALLLGDRFPNINPFYDVVKRRVIGTSRRRLFDTPGLTQEAIKDICDFGYRLKASGFFTEFTYVSQGLAKDPKKRPTILFDIPSDSRVRHFFVGGWFERYVFQVVKNSVQRATGTWCDEQFAKGVTVEFPDRTDGEFDVLVSVSPDQLLWLECKTGQWQKYIDRFKSINQKFLKIPRDFGALVLVDELDAAEKASATELTGLTVIHFSELGNWLPQALSKMESARGTASS